MTLKHRAQLQSILEALHSQLVLEIADALRSIHIDALRDAEDQTDPDQLTLTEGTISELIGIKTAMLHRLDDALARLEGGNYGICSHCDGEIAEDHIKVDPFTMRCAACEDRLARGPASEPSVDVPVSETNVVR